ncbi:MAG TPA: hypothetical protein VMB50_06965 [Myxococcales bacterium]|nr:hypothetical protein [Myxococcales bacterium]
MLRKTVPLALVLTALACAPPASTYDAGCYPAPISSPVTDAGPGNTSGCTWTGGCATGSADALTSKFHGQFNANATCEAATDCALYGEFDGGSLYRYECYETTYTQPINASMRPALDQCLEAMIASYCGQCFPDGGLVQGDVSPPEDAGYTCTEVECVSGQCQETQF